MNAPVRLVKRPKTGSLASTRVDCPACEGAATHVGAHRLERHGFERRHCSHCGLRCIVDRATWAPIEESLEDPRFSNGGTK